MVHPVPRRPLRGLPGGDMHVKVYADGAPVKSTEDYRLRIEGE